MYEALRWTEEQGPWSISNDGGQRQNTKINTFTTVTILRLFHLVRLLCWRGTLQLDSVVCAPINQIPRTKYLRFYTQVVIKTVNVVISRVAENSTDLFIRACRTTIFLHSTNEVLNLCRCHVCRCRRWCWSPLLSYLVWCPVAILTQNYHLN